MTDVASIDVEASASDLKVHTSANDAPDPSIFYQMLAEAFGTCLIVILGVNAVHGAVLAGGAAGNFQVGIMFAIGIGFGIWTAGAISGGHLNPAITCAIAVLRPSNFPAWKVPLYILSQTFGGFVGGALNYGLWHNIIKNYETANSIVRGEPSSDVTASCAFGVFPFPIAAKNNNWPLDIINPGQALFVEAFGAGLLCFIVFVMLDSRNITLQSKDAAPIIIGLSIGAMIGIISPLTTGCFNPARDFGPRLFGLMAGWGSRAIPGKDNGFWVYLLGPVLGAICGGSIYELSFHRAYSGKKI